MLQEATNISVLARSPWMLAPAVAMFLVALSVHLVAGTRRTGLPSLTTRVTRPVVDSPGRADSLKA